MDNLVTSITDVKSLVLITRTKHGHLVTLDRLCCALDALPNDARWVDNKASVYLYLIHNALTANGEMGCVTVRSDGWTVMIEELPIRCYEDVCRCMHLYFELVGAHLSVSEISMSATRCSATFVVIL